MLNAREFDAVLTLALLEVWFPRHDHQFVAVRTKPPAELGEERRSIGGNIRLHDHDLGHGATFLIGRTPRIDVGSEWERSARTARRVRFSETVHDARWGAVVRCARHRADVVSF